MENGNRPISPITDETTIAQMGLTKREYFAGLAMQGVISSYTEESLMFRHQPNEISAQIATCIDWADELLKQLEKPTK